ncbi:MAG: hypothetical protein M3Q45_10550 [Chloroflexota bacterium]|nr:hypothetical protein [Chloroflexota bacterium]
MYQPSVIPTTVSSDLAESWQQTLTDNRLRTLRALGVEFSLPSTLRTFLLFFLSITIIGAGLTMHILLSMQLWQTTVKIEQLQARYRAIEQHNSALIWSIAQKSTLESVGQRAADMGYAVALNRHYVAVAQPVLLAAGPTTGFAINQRSANQPLVLAAAPIVPLPSPDDVQMQPTDRPLRPSTRLVHSLSQWWKTQWQKFISD